MQGHFPAFDGQCSGRVVGDHPFDGLRNGGFFGVFRPAGACRPAGRTGPTVLAMLALQVLRRWGEPKVRINLTKVAIQYSS